VLDPMPPKKWLKDAGMVDIGVMNYHYKKLK